MSLKTISSKLPRLQLPQLPEKLKGTIVERWVNYWKGLASDYADVVIESGKTIRAKPLKSSVYGSLAVFAYGCCKTNPNKREFTNQLMASEQLVSLVSVQSQRPETVEYLKMIEQSQNEDTLRITSLGLFSIMWIDDFASELSTYDAKCDYLQPELKTFHQRIIDIGWMNTWWNLKTNLKNYDVNY